MEIKLDEEELAFAFADYCFNHWDTRGRLHPSDEYLVRIAHE